MVGELGEVSLALRALAALYPGGSRMPLAYLLTQATAELRMVRALLAMIWTEPTYRMMKRRMDHVILGWELVLKGVDGDPTKAAERLATARAARAYLDRLAGEAPATTGETPGAGEAGG